MADTPFLLTPGPVPVPPEVLAVQSEPQQHHRSAAFVATYGEVLRKLKLVFRTEHDVLLFTASGTGRVRVGLRQPDRAGRSRAVRHRPARSATAGWRWRGPSAPTSTVLRVRVGAPARSRRRGRGDGRRDAAAGRRRALRDLHGDRDRHPGDRRAHARAQVPARDRRRLEPRRGADRDRRLGARRRRLGLAEGHVHAARALVRERLARGLGAQPRRPARRASTSTGSARSTPRTAAAARSRPRPPPSTRSTWRSTACSTRASRRSGSARAGSPGASVRACWRPASSSTRPTTSRARS